MKRRRAEGKGPEGPPLTGRGCARGKQHKISRRKSIIWRARLHGE